MTRYLKTWEKSEKFENWPEKSGDLKIDQKIRRKSGNFIKLTDWQSPIEQTSHQCWKQNVRNLGLELYTCDFSANLRKCPNYLLFNSWNSEQCSSDYRRFLQSLKFLIAKLRITSDCRFQIFWFNGHFRLKEKKVLQYPKTNMKILPNFQ